MPANANVKCDFASLKHEQMLGDKYFIETCFSKKYNSYPPKEVLNDTYMVIRMENNDKSSSNKHCPKEEICVTISTTTTTTIAVVLPDFVLSVDIDALTFTEEQERDFIANITEIMDSPSISPIIFRIMKISGFDITYDPLAITADFSGGTSVNNPHWIFTEDSNFITCTLKPDIVLVGFGNSAVGFTVTRKVDTPDETVQNISIAIVTGSGGDSNILNNTVLTSITAN
jgi:hypothetical protein